MDDQKEGMDGDACTADCASIKGLPYLQGSDPAVVRVSVAGKRVPGELKAENLVDLHLRVPISEVSEIAILTMAGSINLAQVRHGEKRVAS
jgi:hypothetical protein